VEVAKVINVRKSFSKPGKSRGATPWAGLPWGGGGFEGPGDGRSVTENEIRHQLLCYLYQQYDEKRIESYAWRLPQEGNEADALHQELWMFWN